MRFQCPECKGIIDYEGKDSSVDVKCGHCGHTVNLPPGKTSPGCVLDDFLIVRFIAAGGMGEVFLARQMSLDRDVALKILRPKFAEDTEFIRLFIQEARAAAKLNHPNVVQAYAVGESDGLFFFAMEYVDGKTMKEILSEQKNGKIDPMRAARIVRDIADALNFAWTEYKIVHHDIKPDNIMISSSGRAKLADLGLAQIGSDNGENEDDEVLGTPQYISPEQLTGEPTDVRSDIYSLGATFYQFVTGKFPFDGDTPEEIGHKHLDAPLVPPDVIDKDVPREVSNIIVKMMAKATGDRYQSGKAVTDALDKYIAHVEDSTRGVKLAMPTVNVNKVKTGSVPTPGSSLGDLSKMPVSAPKITMSIQKQKKDEPVAEPKSEDVVAKPEEKVSSEPSKTASDNTKKTSSGKKTATKKTNSVILAAAALVVLLGGGAAFLFLTPQGKTLIGSMTKNSSAPTVRPSSMAPKKEVKVAVPKESPEKLRLRLYREQAALLNEFLAGNPNAEEELLRRVDAFLESPKYGYPRNPSETEAIRSVLETYSRVDERLRIEPVREAGRRRIQERISAAQRAQEYAQQQQREIEARRLSELQRRRAEEERRREEARLRRETEEQNRLAAMGRLTEYRKLVSAERNKVFEAFRSFLRTGDIDKESVVKIADEALAFAANRTDGMLSYEIQEAKSFERQIRDAKAEIPYCSRIRSFLRNPVEVASSSFEVRPGELVKVETCAPDGFHVLSKMSGKRYVIPYTNEAFRTRFFRTVKRRTKLAHFPFYFSLILGHRAAPELRDYPNGFFRANLNLFF